MKKIKYPLSYAEFKAIYSKVPRLCVELVILSSQGILFLMRKNNGWEGMWHLPGGTLYYRETVAKCIKRVAREEVGIKVEVQKLLGYNEFPSEIKERGFGTAVTLVFLCTTKNNIVSCPDTVQFFSSLPKNIVQEHKKFLKIVDLM